MRAFAAALVLLFALPLAGAVPDTPEEIAGTDVVASWSMLGPTGHCSSWEPVLYAVSAPVASTLTHVAGDAGVAFEIHLAGTPLAGCPDFDLAFEAPHEPWTTLGAFVPITSACGATGSFITHASEPEILLYFELDVPGSCDAGHAGQLSLYANVQPVRPAPALVCAPIHFGLAGNCVGAYEPSRGEMCGEPVRELAVVAVTQVLTVRDSCDPWTGEPQREIYVGPFATVSIIAPEDACILAVGDPLGVAGHVVECPAEVSDALYAVPWFDVLP